VKNYELLYKFGLGEEVHSLSVSQSSGAGKRNWGNPFISMNDMMLLHSWRFPNAHIFISIGTSLITTCKADGVLTTYIQWDLPIPFQEERKKKKMSRSAADATRFTATGPYASSKAAGLGLPLSTPYRLPGFQPKQPSTRKQETETPRQKVERLRAQARAARLAQSTSRVDRIIEGGRKWANQAHKVMIYSLIAASGRSKLALSSAGPSIMIILIWREF
jgi:hypothetical protein